MDNILEYSERELIKDEIFIKNIDEESLANRLFLRVGAKQKKFTNINFTHSYFDSCYFRNCVFDSCTFTGCRFKDSNFTGSTFEGCVFNYTNFQNTFIDEEVLDKSCPAFDNLKQKFARSLRVNYQMLGDKKAVNKAIKVELAAENSHLYKAVWSNESYYRKKYKGFDRIKYFGKWLSFKYFDFIWGNGESLFKLVRTTLILMLIMTIYDVIFYRDFWEIDSYWQALKNMPATFFSIIKPCKYGDLYLSMIYFFRLVLFALFMSIILKKYNRR